MAISQSVWSLDDQKPLQAAKLKDEAELEGLLYAHIELLNPSWLVIDRQITMLSGKRLDLLCIDQDGDLIVVELKKELSPPGKLRLRPSIMLPRCRNLLRQW